MDADTLARILADARWLPVLRGSDAVEVMERARSLIDAGSTVVEITTTVPGWADVLRGLAEAGAVLGAGTVVNAVDAGAAVEAGAAFCVSPCPSPEARDACGDLGIPFVEGGFTPLEVSDAASRGIAKLFPAHVGGPDYLRSILSVWPDARIVVTGGIAPDDVDRWIEAGALAVGLGRALPDRAT